jgi:hypothetical protein
MSQLPKVSISYSNKNLLQAIAALDGICGIVGTVATVGLQGVPKQVFSLDDAISKGFTEGAEPKMYRHLKEFYEEVGGEQELWIMGVAGTEKSSDVLDNTDPAGAIKLIKAANGRIRMLAVFSNVATAGADFWDGDVHTAVTAAQAFAAARLTELIPCRILIEGKVNSTANAMTFVPSTASAGFVGLVVGGSVNDGTASLGIALGRAAKYAAHIKLGKVANGPLTISEVFIGATALADYVGLDVLHGSGVISFMQHPNKAGFYFGIDRMCSTDDFRLLAYGRIIDKAAVIAAAIYIEELEAEVDVDQDGKISELDLEHLKGRIEMQVKNDMEGQISKNGVTALIDPKQDIISTGILNVKLKITPKGYTGEIDVELGLNAPQAA